MGGGWRGFLELGPAPTTPPPRPLFPSCIAICFLQSGLEIDLSMFRRIGPVAVRLLLLPGIVDACALALAAGFIFRMPPLFALALGFLCKACDPCVVISTMVGYQERGAGVKAGIPSLLVAAASLDDIVAIALYSVFIVFAVPSTSSSNKAWDIASAPLQLVFGAGLGLAGAALASLTKIWRTPAQRVAVVLASALACMMGMASLHLSGAGVLASIVLGAGVAAAWTAGFPRCASTGANAAHAVLAEHSVAAVWRWVGQPLLFGVVGTQVVFSKIAAPDVPRALAVIAVGWVARFPAAYGAVSCSHLTPKQKLFVALNWLPKATVQAALAAGPLERVEAEAPGDAALMRWGEDALVTALLSVLVCAPISVALVAMFGPRLVPPDGEGGEGTTAPLPKPTALRPPRRLASVDAAALAAMPAAGTARAHRQRQSLPSVLPGVLRPERGGVVEGAEGGGDGGRPEFATTRFEDTLLADIDPAAASLLQDVELDAWTLEAADGGLGRAAAAATAARLNRAAAGMRRLLLARGAGDGADRVDGAREFFARVRAADDDGGGADEESGPRQRRQGSAPLV